MRCTIKALADELGVSVSSVKRVLRGSAFATMGNRIYESADTALDADEAAQVREEHARGRLDRERGRQRDVERTREDRPRVIISAARAGMAAPPVARRTTRDDRDVVAEARSVDSATAVNSRMRPSALDDAQRYGPARHRLFVHQQLLEALNDTGCPASIRRALTHRARQLMTYGRTTRSKGVRGRNAGWTRVPLGGNSGFHHYLWLLASGDRLRGDHAAALYGALPEGARILRAIRHHDETDVQQALSVGTAADYVELTPDALFGTLDDGLDDPLTLDQRRSIDSDARVRLIEGHPGSGKTTTLFASAARLRGSALYLTLSDALVEQAQHWFETAAPRGVSVTAMSWDALLRRLDPDREATHGGTIAHVDELGALLRPLGAKLGPWLRDGEPLAHELYNELNAHMFGAALPVQFRDRPAVARARLSPETYRSLRLRVLGEPAVRGALAAAHRLSDDDANRLFDAPVRAFDVARALDRGTVDGHGLSFDWVLVDEVQDLTLVEQWLLIDWVARMAVERATLPAVIFAGDEAQTVRPTAFEWGALRELAVERLGARSSDARGDHELYENLRAPHELAVFLNNARRCLYRSVHKQHRPRGVAECEPADSTVGRVVAVEWADASDGPRALFRAFADAKGTAALIYPAAIVPDRWKALAREEGVVLWTSESAKGLEFRAVGVLDVQASFERVRTLGGSAHEAGLRTELARSAVDHLLVALSRSAETLVLLSERWSDDQLRQLDALCAAPTDDESAEGRSALGRFSLDELVVLLDADAADARAKVEALIDQSTTCSGRGAHVEAELLARNACNLLGAPGRPGAAGLDLRTSARTRWARTLVELALPGLDPREWRRASLMDAARQWQYAKDTERSSFASTLARALFDDATTYDVMRALQTASERLAWLETNEPSLVATVMRALQAKVALWTDEQLVPATPKGREALLCALRTMSATASTGRDAIGQWYRRSAEHLCEWWLASGDAATEFAALRAHVAEDSGAVFDARACERAGELERAATKWEALAHVNDALRCLRAARDYALAAELAERHGLAERATLRWLARALEVLGERPDGALEESDATALVQATNDAVRERGRRGRARRWRCA
jgi:hypothetical protein